MRAFTEKHGAFVARLDAAEREVVAALVADVAQLLGAPRFDEAGPAAAPAGPLLRTERIPPPQDPAVRRLLPDASQDDPDVAAEFRRLTEDDLRARKVARLGVMWTLLTTPGDGRRHDLLTVAPKDAPELAAAITDLRLVLAERLDVRTDQDAESLYDVLSDDAQGQDVDVRRYLVSLYGALSWLQESLVGLMLEHARRGGASGRPAHEG
ncbi:DUF2017 domain-containing protein [Cellulomonas sp. H30R-01]|uniref:DUF2017 domain-containing protein n=1 Tax=Cellulomonas sp. H30R-01 TaxID=2704467 RepID=UPI00138C2693|nr:DUF2017 domain-containing protein [Cellulomonas sp. H30R-01]QHT55257.1 DUF2017 domain-containing protein [Cellulomonas sp. H30R-01]